MDKWLPPDPEWELVYRLGLGRSTWALQGAGIRTSKTRSPSTEAHMAPAPRIRHRAGTHSWGVDPRLAAEAEGRHSLPGKTAQLNAAGRGLPNRENEGPPSCTDHGR